MHRAERYAHCAPRSRIRERASHLTPRPGRGAQRERRGPGAQPRAAPGAEGGAGRFPSAPGRPREGGQGGAAPREAAAAGSSPSWLGSDAACTFPLPAAAAEPGAAGGGPRRGRAGSWRTAWTTSTSTPMWARSSTRYGLARFGPSPPRFPFLPRPPSPPRRLQGPPRGAGPRRHCSAAPPQGFPAAPQGAPRGGTERDGARPRLRPGPRGLRAGPGGERRRSGAGVSEREREGGRPRASAFPPALLSPPPQPSRPGERPLPGGGGERCHCSQRGRSGGGPSGRREERGLVLPGGMPPAGPARAARASRERRGFIRVRKWRCNARNFLDGRPTSLVPFSLAFPQKPRSSLPTKRRCSRRVCAPSVPCAGAALLGAALPQNGAARSSPALAGGSRVLPARRGRRQRGSDPRLTLPATCNCPSKLYFFRCFSVN